MRIDYTVSVKIFLAWWKAFRPLSLSIALVSCGLGVMLSYYYQKFVIINAVLVIIAGGLLQAGVNLINDFFEYKQRKLHDKIPELQLFGATRNLVEWGIFLTGLGCFALVIPIGLYLVYVTGIPLLILGIIGFAGGYFYTGYPFCYKNKGLGVVFVFFLMGVFMITGSFYAITGTISKEIVLISIPVSLLVSAILLTNELRDYEADKSHDLKTLVVRCGLLTGKILYILLVLLAYIVSIILFFNGLFPHLYFIFLGLPFVFLSYHHIIKPEGKRKFAIPFMMIHHIFFGTAFIATYYLNSFSFK